EPECSYLVAKVDRGAVGRVGEQNTFRDTVGDGTLEHLNRQLGFCLEDDLVRNACFSTTVRCARPTLGEVQFEVDRQVLCRGRPAEAHADLTVGDLPCGARVLPLNSDRVRPLFEETRVVDDPGVDGLPGVQGLDPVLGRLSTNVAIAPRRVFGE